MNKLADGCWRNFILPLPPHVHSSRFLLPLSRSLPSAPLRRVGTPRLHRGVVITLRLEGANILDPFEILKQTIEPYAGLCLCLRLFICTSLSVCLSPMCVRLCVYMDMLRHTRDREVLCLSICDARSVCLYLRVSLSPPPLSRHTLQCPLQERGVSTTCYF